jgi:D-beta-D-heptose 7-phosphate kinase/D-beta-D-heptose 1-phosphate adenosyltransferase
MHSKIKTVGTPPPPRHSAGRWEKIVFTNGCFDIIHTGHTRYLEKARSFGEVLVVAINSDSSVRLIKGEKRPINPEAERSETLAALESVDYVVIFDEPDPYRIISELRPDVLVKGGDWPIEKIVGKDVVEARGGRVISMGYIEGASTTGIIDKIVKLYR